MLPIFAGIDFDAVIDFYTAGNQVNLPPLLWFDFADGPELVWPGQYDIQAGGYTWQGLGAAGRILAIDGLEQAMATDASQATIKLSGVDARIAAIAAASNRADYVGQLLGVYALFCDKDWQPITAPMADYAGVMGTMTQDRALSGTGWVRTITLPVSNLMYGRGISKAAYWTDRDQQLRYPNQGDTGMTQIPSLQDTEIPVPWK